LSSLRPFLSQPLPLSTNLPFSQDIFASQSDSGPIFVPFKFSRRNELYFLPGVSPVFFPARLKSAVLTSRNNPHFLLLSPPLGNHPIFLENQLNFLLNNIFRRHRARSSCFINLVFLSSFRISSTLPLRVIPHLSVLGPIHHPPMPLSDPCDGPHPSYIMTPIQNFIWFCVVFLFSFSLSHF